MLVGNAFINRILMPAPSVSILSERPENGSARTIICNDSVEDKRRKGGSLGRSCRYSAATDAGGL